MSATTDFSTSILPRGMRAQGWAGEIARSYFPLDLTYREPDQFSGSLRTWALGEVQASRLSSEAVMYRRRYDHVHSAGEEEFLLTIPRTAPVRFLQMGREVVCPPGGFILERGNEPYEFSYDRANDLVVAKIGHRELANRLGDPGRYCAIEFDASKGVAALMVELLCSSGEHAQEMNAVTGLSVGSQLVDLIALAIEQNPHSSTAGESAVRTSHLNRISETIGQMMTDPGLSPSSVASACGISVRYLHDLCRSNGQSFCDRLREKRLQSARGMLVQSGSQLSITEIAYCCGFTDASTFSRSYRARFDESPRATRSRFRN